MCLRLFLAVCLVALALVVLGTISANATATGVARRHATMMCQVSTNIASSFSINQKERKKENEQTNIARLVRFCGKHGINQDVKLLCKPTH